MTLLTVTWKDLRLVARDKGALLFTTLVPIMVVTIVASVLGAPSAGVVLLPVVNEDEGPVAEVLIQMLDKNVDVVAVESKAAAALVIPERTSKRYLGDRASTLRLLIDPAKENEVAVVKSYFLLADREASALADPLYQERLALEEESITSARLRISSTEQAVAGFSIMFVLMGVLFGVAFGLYDEREWGTLTRLRVAPIPRVALLGGKLLARFFVGLAQMLILFFWGHLVFGISLGGSYAAFVLMSMAVVLSMTGFSLLVSSLTRSREQVIPLGLTVVMIVCAIGGCWWPEYQSPDWLQSVGQLALTSWAMDGINNLILRDRTITDVVGVMGILVAYGLACGAGDVRLQRLGV